MPTSDSGIEDVAYLNLDFGDGLLASFHVNWLSPVKIRHFLVGGSRKGLVYNDLAPDEKIKVYDRGITVSQDPEARRGLLIGYRTGDVWSPHIEGQEPLQAMVRHFAECIRDGKTAADQRRGRPARRADPGSRPTQHQGPRRTNHPLGPAR